jgi:putative salt-induced outer membrane protein YdiY
MAMRIGGKWYHGAGGTAMKPAIRAVFALFLGVVAAGASARADEIHLENGDVIRGELIGADDKAVHLKHVYGTDIVVPWDRVDSLVSDKPIELRLVDGSRIKGKLRPGPLPKTVSLETEAAGTVTGVDLQRVIALNEPADTSVWTGRIALGVTIQDGNSKSQSFFGAFDGERLSKLDRIEAHINYAYQTTNDELTTKKGFSRVQYSYYLHRPLYIYAGGALEFDKFRDLRLRARGGGGVGYAVIESKALILRVESGAEYVNEDYFDTDDLAFVALRESIQLEWQVTDWMRLSESFEIFPNAKKFSDFVSRSNTGVNISLFAGFGFAAVILWDHDEIPSPGSKRDDTTYALTFTYAF